MPKNRQSPQSYQCTQLFGYRSLSQKYIDQDKISALKFNRSGSMLAIGDRAGRVIIFNADDKENDHTDYDYYYEFQSHNPESECDTLRNVTRDEQINHICWFTTQGKYNKMLTSNSNSIKLWKFYEKSNRRQQLFSGQAFQFQQQQIDPIISINLKKVIPNTHESLINKLQISNNQEYIFASNSESILIWSTQNYRNPYILKQLSKSGQNEKHGHENITCSQLHPQTESLFVFGTNKGGLYFNDARTSLNQAHTLAFKGVKDQSHFLSELIKSYSSVSFIQGTRKIITRDLISIKVWDMCNNKQPIVSEYLDQNIKTRLCELFEADCLDDKFSLSSSKGSFVTGNYSNSFHVIDPQGRQNYQYELDFSKQTLKRKVGDYYQKETQFDSDQKVLIHDFNQKTGQIAVSTRNSFFIFSQSQ